MFDLIVKGATLPDGRTGLDIAVRDGRIAAVERGIAGEARRTIDAASMLSATASTPAFLNSRHCCT